MYPSSAQTHMQAREFVCNYISKEFVNKNDEIFDAQVERCVVLYQSEGT